MFLYPVTVLFSREGKRPNQHVLKREFPCVSPVTWQLEEALDFSYSFVDHNVLISASEGFFENSKSRLFLL